MKQDFTLTALFAADIAIWLRVHCDDAWTVDNEAVQLLAARLARVALTQNDGSETT